MAVDYVRPDHKSHRWMIPTIQRSTAPTKETHESGTKGKGDRADRRTNGRRTPPRKSRATTSARISTRQIVAPLVLSWWWLGTYTIAAVTVTGRPVWQPRSWRFILLRTLNALPQPACVQRNGFSPVWLCEWMRRLEGREKALWQVRQM